MTKSAIASRIAFLSTRIDATALRDGGNWGCLDDIIELDNLQSLEVTHKLISCHMCGQVMELPVECLPKHTGLCFKCGTTE